MSRRGRKRSRAETETAWNDILLEYEAWLRSRGVWWDSRLRVRPPQPASKSGKKGMLQGWGVSCLANVNEGEVVIRIPRDAVFCVDSLPHVAEALRQAKLPCALEPATDSQMPLAVALLHGRESDAWKGKLRTEVTPATCSVAWLWNEDGPWKGGEEGSGSLSALLCGTELEGVIQAKRHRILQEFRQLTDLGGLLPDGTCITDYIAACAVVISRVQPWFGGSFVPIVTQANHTWTYPHVEFTRRGSFIEGRALMAIPPGELYQSYGDLSTADGLYRYGIGYPAQSSREVLHCQGDSVTFDMGLLVAIIGETPADMQGRCSLLIASGLLEESQWDVIDGVTGVELCFSAKHGRVVGLRRLLATLHILSLSEEEWSAVSASSKTVLGEARQRAMRAAHLVQASCFSRAYDVASPTVGGGRRVQWSKLLPADHGWASSKVKSLALQALMRRDALYPSVGCLSLEEDEVNFDACVNGMEQDVSLAMQLRLCERRMLHAAMEELVQAT